MTQSYDSFGASRFPLAPGQPSGASYDKGLATLVGLITAAVKANCDTAWRYTLTQLHDQQFLSGSLGKERSTIGSVMTVMPTPQTLMQLKAGWPLLAIYREGEPQDEALTIDIPAYRQRWGVDWVVGPLSPENQRKLGHYWVQVANTIRAVIENGHHPAYLNDAECFVGEFVSIKVLHSTSPSVLESIVNEQGSGYFGGSCILESIERFTAQSGAELDTFNADAYAPLGSGYGDNWTETAVDPVIDFEYGTPDV